MTFGITLKRHREAAGLTQEGLALRCGFATQSRIANYENGNREPDYTDLRALAQALNISVSALLSEPAEDPEWANVVAYGQAVGLGNPKEAAEYAETHKLKFRASSLRRKGLNPDKLMVVYGEGDSMLPRISSGDAILYDSSDTRPRDECVFVIRRGAEYSAKRCQILDGIVFFSADNPNGDHLWKRPVRMDNAKDPIEILGRVRWIGSWED